MAVTVKRLFLLLFAILAGCAVVPDQSNYGPANDFQVLKDAPGYGKDSLYELSKMWIAENFRSAKTVIEYENKPEGMLIGNGAVDYPCTGNEPYFDKGFCGQPVTFTTKLEVKDNKFRLSFSNLAISGGNRFPKDGIPNLESRLSNFGNEILIYLDKSKAKSSW